MRQRALSLCVFTATLNASLYKVLYVHFSSGSPLDLLRQIALELDLEAIRAIVQPIEIAC
jgi:hypothetical protein